MLRHYLIALCLACSALAVSQIADVESSNKMASHIVDLINKKDAKAVVAMASDEFLKEASPLQIGGLVNGLNSLGALQEPQLILDLREQRHYKVLVRKEGKPDDAILLVLGVESPTKFFSIGAARYKEPKAGSSLKSDNRRKSKADEAVHAAVMRYAGQYEPAGISIGVFRLGKESLYNYGETAKGNGALPTKRTVYEIGSITKTMTGLLLARVEIDRKLTLDDDIRKLLPGDYPNLEFKGQPILLKHLVTHTSGLPGNPPGIPDEAGGEAYAKYSHEKLLADLKTINLRRTPGASFSYSNMGAGLCAIILERAYGKSYEALLNEVIFRPLKMRDTGITLPPAMDKLYAAGHDAKGASTDRWTVNGIEAAGAVRSTATDMLRYAKFQLESKNALVSMSHRVLNDNPKMCMFWQRKDSRTGGQCFTHEGGTGGFTSNVIVMPEQGLAVVVLMNSGEQNAGQLAYEIALRILNESS